MKRKFGFTLVEIIVALAIIAILAAVAIPAYRNYVTRARVAEALEFADAARTSIIIEDAGGGKLDDRLLYMDTSNGVPRTLGTLQWFKGKPGDGLKGYIISGLYLPAANPVSPNSVMGFVLEWRENGDWHCVNASKHPNPKAPSLDAKYLPAICNEGSDPMAKAGAGNKPAQCPPGQDKVTLKLNGVDMDACSPACAAGQTRDSANPSQCKETVCGPNEVKHHDTKLCVTIPPKPQCQPGSDAFRTWSNNNDPEWGCFDACPAGQMPGMGLKCIPDPAAKVAAPAVAAPAAKAVPSPQTPAASPGAAPAGTGRRPGAAALQPVTCQVCDPAVPELCELVTVPKVCTYPNNFCITFVDNQDDGTKVVTRDCGNYDRAYTEWFQGTSDDDKCRERINVEQHLAFTCTFACESDNCNSGLRPAEDSLFQLK